MKKIVGYLLTAIAGGALGGGAGFLILTKLSDKIIEKKDFRIDKFVGYFNLLDQWIAMKEEGKSVESYFKYHNYSEIAIYGLGKVGNHLLKELKETDIQVLYGIDRKGDALSSDIEVYTLKEELPEVDVIVVTPTFDYYDIKEKLEKKVDSRIVSIDDVIYELI